MKHSCTYHSPIGILVLSEEEGKLTKLYLQQDDISQQNVDNSPVPATKLLQTACRQLDEYFAGKRKDFDLPLAMKGTDFQQKVWAALREIPYGETRSYADIAERIGNPKGVRAVGQANNRNPILIITPCHRVIHKNGDISGFGCGNEVKRYLLNLEGILSEEL